MATAIEQMTNLEESRVQLLRELGPRLDSWNIDHLDSLEVHRYNKIVDQINDLQGKYDRITIDNIPLEVLVEILGISAVRDPELGINIDRLLELTLVCTTWSTLIITTPRLWTSIDCVENVEDAEAKTELALQLSRNLPLSLVYDHGSAVSRYMASLVIPYASRVHSLISVNTYILTGLPMVTCFSPLTLRKSTVRNPDDNYLYETSAAWLGLPALKQLTAVDLGRTTKHSVMSLVPLQTLKSVTTYLIDLSEEDIHELKRCLTEVGRLSWTHFKSWESPWKAIQPLLISMTSSITHLTLKIDETSLQGLVDILCQMENLNSLCLAAYVSRTRPVQMPNWSSKKPLSIRSLTLRTLRYFGAGIAYDIMPLIAAFCNRCSLLLFLELDSDEIRMTDINSHILERLARLSIQANRIYFEGTLDVDEMELAISADHFGHITWPKTLSLKLKLYYLDEDNSSFLIDDDQWPNLRNLLIAAPSYNTCSHGRLRLSQLRRLECDQTVIQSVCHAVALYPASVPLLSELVLLGKPEWDILFIILDRRLFMLADGISPIKLLRLQCAPPLDLHNALVGRLRGRLLERPPYTETSIQFNLHKVLLPDLYTIKYRFDKPLDCRFIHYLALGESLDGESVMKPLPPYPHSDQEVLDTWVERTTAIRSRHAREFSSHLCSPYPCTLSIHSEYI